MRSFFPLKNILLASQGEHSLNSLIIHLFFKNFGHDRLAQEIR